MFSRQLKFHHIITFGFVFAKILFVRFDQKSENRKNLLILTNVWVLEPAPNFIRMSIMKVYSNLENNGPATVSFIQYIPLSTFILSHCHILNSFLRKSTKRCCWKRFSRIRSSRLEVLCRKGVLRNSAKFFKKKPVPESLFLIKLQATLLKKRLWHNCFTFFYRTPPVAASEGLH